MVAIALLARSRRPLWRAALAALVLLLACYGAVAAGRGALVTDAGWPAAVALTLRYHYMAPCFLVLIAGCAAAAAAARIQPGAAVSRLVACTGLMVCLVGIALAPRVIDHYPDERRAVQEGLDSFATATASQPGTDALYIRNRRFLPVGWFTPEKQFPGHAGLFVIFNRANALAGRPVFFVMTQPAVVESFRRRARSRTKALAVTRDEFRAAVGLPPLAAEAQPSG
jgi:hypothetical protein